MVYSKMIELKPNRDLLDVNFEGYKLSLEPIRSYQNNFECGVDHVFPSDEQYSFIHLKVFSLHNHLYGDPWSQEDVYFIDRRWRIQQNLVNRQTGLLECVRQVWEIPSSRPRQPGHYNPSLSFSSEDMAIIADGTGLVYLLATGTGQRNEAGHWKVIFSGEICGASQPFIICDSRLKENLENHTRELHCLLMWVQEVPRKEEQEPTELINKTVQTRMTNFQSALTWIVLVEAEGGNWSQSHSYCLAGNGEFDYIALESNCSSLYVASEETIKFTEDSERSIDLPKKEIKEAQNGENMGKKHYMWQQGTDDIEITFNIAENVQKREIEVDVKNKSLNVLCRGNVLLDGGLWGCTDPELSCWVLENKRLQITLSKAEPGLMWQALIPSDSRGEEVLDPALVEEVHQRLAHLCSDKEVTDTTHMPAFNSEQLEECDTGRTNSILMRLDPRSHTISHQASLGGHQALFCTRISGSKAKALCLRHDVDGCIWQPSPPQDTVCSEWPIEHIGTFHAFGYVQASKQQRKFTVCAPDLSYVAICDTSRHVYIYRRPVDVQGSLKNRKTGQKIQQMAHQQIIDLYSTSEILGAHAGNHTLHILTSDFLRAFMVN